MLAYNTSNAYDAEATYYGATVLDRPVVTVEVDFVSTEFRLVEADEFTVPVYNSSNTYNTSFTYEGDSPFVDVTQYVTSVEIERGRSAQTYDHYDAGTARITFVDTDSRFMPGNSSSPYYPHVTTMRPIRVRAGWSGEDFGLFRGYVDRWEVQWDQSADVARVTVTATDLTKVLTKLDTTVDGLDGDSPKTRIDAMLDAHAIPADFRVLDTGDTTLIQDLTDRRPLWPVCQDIETAEAGALFIDGFGRIVFKSRTNSQPTGAGYYISDSRSNAMSYSDVAVTTDDETLYNFVSVTIPGGTEQTAGDTASEDEYQRRALIMTDVLLETDAQALTLANYLLTVRGIPGVRVETVTLPVYASVHNQQGAVALDLLTPVTLERAAPGGYSFSQALYISGVKHTISIDDWTLEYSTQPQAA